ncbi:family 43 glycosylhydrolase [candidate division KSB1 bacterium]|nr:family 43 glycosylhydrolase [candidate division KSB1 bacterium]
MIYFLIINDEMRMTKFIWIFLLFSPLWMHAVDNPVLINVADSGVLKYNGQYYLIGTRTSGNMYVSDDLIHWRGPIHAFSMQNDWTFDETAKDHQIHACDLNYLNGIFHLYWSVNHRGKPYTTRLIGHAVSSDALGPYSEPVSKTWFDESIDAHLFIDEDGTPFFYTVKFTDGNTIWGSELADPWHHKGQPVMLLTANPRTWEWKDHKVIEGPFVIRYRDQYYMLYNANHTGARFGNYAIGCAVVSHPLDFNNATKYDCPLVESNFERIKENAAIIIPSARCGVHTWKYTTKAPHANWSDENFDDSTWQEGVTGFGYPDIRNSSSRIIRTEWKTSDIWLRSTFTPEVMSQFSQLEIAHSGQTEVFLNGMKVYEGSSIPFYALIDISRTGWSNGSNRENTIAIHSQHIVDSDEQYIDVGLIDPQTQRGDEFIFNPGQPNLVRGVNGFEWWLSYFGIFNSGPKSQAVDRVYFFGKEMFVDGPTGKRTPGYHPNPAKPAFSDIFNADIRADLGKKWRIRSGSWHADNGQANQTDGTGYAEALIDCERASHYLFEVNLKFSDKTGEKIGVIAYYDESDNYLKIFINRKSESWGYVQAESGKLKTASFPLPDNFNYRAYHNLKILKNGKSMEVFIDQRPAPGQKVIWFSDSRKGEQGIFTENAKGAFDGIIYTLGWDEFDANITGWGNSFRGEKSSGRWSTAHYGITQNEALGVAKIFKGDLLARYEFMTQLTASNELESKKVNSTMGIYPIYIDSLNWLRTEIDFRNHQLVAYGIKEGKTISTLKKDLSYHRRIHPTIVYSDRQTMTFNFNSATKLSELEIVFDDFGQSQEFPSLRFFYREDGLWKPIHIISHRKISNQYANKVSFDTLQTDALRIKEKFGNPLPGIKAVYSNIIFKPDYNLRSVKLDDKVIIFVDGREMMTVNGEWIASQVGLVTNNLKCRFNGITLFGF